tara:strand:+ start:228 stop:617 length:390 start_codon:yes stop_codon:yes gene_type:complete
MKVTITKTTEVSRLANEIRAMIHQAKNELVYGLPEKMNEVIRLTLSSKGEEFFAAIDMIESYRQDLASYDNAIQEIQNILIGYKNAVDPPAQGGEEEQQDEEWLKQEEAQYEKLMAQIDGVDEAENEEG